MRIAFHVSHFTFRGTESALFDYAIENRRILLNESFIVTPRVHSLPIDQRVLKKFGDAFQIYSYDSKSELEEWCVSNTIDAIYVIKYGGRDEFVWKIPTLVHSVFFMKEKHGFVYAGVSPSVSSTGSERYEYVPHIISLPDDHQDFRSQLNIPEEAVVFGRHGGHDTFDIPFVKNAILKALEERNDLYFIFAVRPQIFGGVSHPRIRFIESFTDPKIKRRFINTCDVMCHGNRYMGESFGISVLEFSYCNKPVITYNGNFWHRQHLDNLGEKAILYSSYEELLQTLLTFDKKEYEDRNWDVTSDFSPEKVMRKFDSVFLEPVRKLQISIK